MAGAGIRGYELASALAADADVTLAAPGDGTPPPNRLGELRIVPFDAHDPATISVALADAEVIVAPPLWPRVARAVRRSGARVVFDLYVPEPLETIDFLRDRGRTRRLMYALALDRLDEALHSGHHFMCASEKQRDLWLGALLGRRLISPAVYDRDPTLRELIDVVPFGVPREPPAVMGPGPRERFGLAADDRVVLWNGGLWSWLDAPTAIRAFAQAAHDRPGLRLVFMGRSEHPPAIRAAAEAQAVARELGLLDRSVFFNDSWVPYAERAPWLSQADCALSAHRDHLETRFAFRTRLLDCFWSGLPVVCTSGDDLGDRIERDGLGATAPAGDVEGIANGLGEVLDRGREPYGDALAGAARDLAWPRVAAPLVRWASADGPPPPRLARRGYGRGSGQRLRTEGYRVARRALDSVGLRGWPRL
jgi:glycosyltransferase involved in cell wall biosynthesis